MGEFGDKFRTTREKKGILLDDVSNVTKISARMLQAIEQENFDQLPGGVFNKGFIRAYAKHLGLNDEEAVTDYLACLRQAQIDANAVWEPETRPAPAKAPARAAYAKPTLKKEAPVAEAGRQNGGRHHEVELPHLHLPRAEDVRQPRRDYTMKRGPAVPWTIVAAAALVVILGAVVWMRRHRGVDGESSGPGTQPAQIIHQNQPALPAGGPVASAPASQVISKPAKTAPPLVQPSSSPGPTPAARTNPIVATMSAQKTGTPANDVTVRAFPSNAGGAAGAASVGSRAPAASATNAKAVPLTLVIRAAETSWISVTADGREVSQETLIAPAEASIRASREIVARIGNAAGVSFVFNGKEILAQGAESEAKTFIFDAQGMRIGPNPPAAPNQ